MNSTIPAPNYTQIPNVLLDRMDEMTLAEFKVLMAICRRTFGWHRAEDVISLSQLQEMTGLSRTAVMDGIVAAMDRGLLGRRAVTPHAISYYLIVASDYRSVDSGYQSTQATSSNSGPEPVASDYQELVASDYSHPLKKGLKKLKENTTTRARVGDGGGGGDERMEMETDDEGISPDDSQMAEAETANLKADLVDALGALGVRPEMAYKAVSDRIVTSDRDVILCKRFMQASTANVPAAVLWSQYLSVGRLPPAPYLETSTVTDEQIAAARRLREESGAPPPPPEQYVSPATLAAALTGVSFKRMPSGKRAFAWAQP